MSFSETFNKFREALTYKGTINEKLDVDTVGDLVRSMNESATPEEIDREIENIRRSQEGLPPIEEAGGEADSDYECVYTTLQQFYAFTSFSDILYNGIKASSRDIATNAAAIYTLGSKCMTSPIVMADWTIRADLQKTDLVDSGTVQDIIGPDVIYHHLGQRPGEDRAIVFAQSHIVEKMRDMYKGDLIVRGTAAVKPYDLFYLDDSYTYMYGLAEVGKVVHSISPQTGFVSVIKPDLITRHIELIEQWNRLYTHAIAAGAYGLARFLKFAIRGRLSGAKFMTKLIELRHGTIGFVQRTGAGVINGIDKLFEKLGRAGKIRKAVSAVPGLAKTIGVALGPAIVETVVFGLIDGLIQDIEKVFTNINKVKIYPLMLRDKYFVAGITGSKNLIAFDEGSKDTKGPPDSSGMDYVVGTAGQMALSNGRYLGAPSDRAGTVTSLFGELRSPPLYDKTYKHTGVDIAFYPNDAPITAVQAGTVSTGENPGYGNYIVIDHGEGIQTLYAHLSSFAVSSGDNVKAGQVIGYQGDTGDTRGPHLHIELIINGVQTNILPYLPPAAIKG